MTDEEKKIYEMQSPSTRRLMDLHRENKKAHDAEWPPKGWLTVENAATFEELTGARSLNFQEVKVEEHLRYNRGQYLAERYGEEPVTSITVEKKEKAVESFMAANAATIFAPIKAAFFDILRYSGLLTKEKVKNEK